jgi:RNA polymerase sigma-70 factor (ECF subfamily)
VGPARDSTLDGELYDAGRRAWPEVALEREIFVRYVEERAPGSAEGLRADELYIACACARGDERAMREFDRRYLSEIPSFLARVRPSAHLVDDVRQLVRETLFVQGKIKQYSGRGSLVSWLRVVTLRVTSNLRRGDRANVELQEALPAPGIDPELGAIHRRYGESFQVALRDALTGLGAEERTLLRLHYLDGLNIDKIAIVFNVSRATIGRRIVAVRERIVEETHRLLRDRLGATPGELASLLRVVRSNLAMSLSVVLRERSG